MNAADADEFSQQLELLLYRSDDVAAVERIGLSALRVTLDTGAVVLVEVQSDEP